MHAERTLYDASRALDTEPAANGDSTQPLRAHLAPAPATEQPASFSVVPPVRTIVVDRPPVPATPPGERDAVRSASAPGPVRLQLEKVSIHYEARHAVKSVSLSIHQGEVLALI